MQTEADSHDAHTKVFPADPGAEYDSRLAVSVDVVIFTILNEQLHVLLVRRESDPFQGMWALPGGMIRANETLEDAARRQLQQKTGVRDVYLEQLYTFGDPGRDPRMRVFTVAYYALASADTVRTSEPEEHRGISWWPVEQLVPTAFDHGQIISYALTRLRNKLDYTPVGIELLPEQFTLSELQKVYEAILGNPIDKRNFRKKIRGKDWLAKGEGTRRSGPHRPAQLYRFVERGQTDD